MTSHSGNEGSNVKGAPIGFTPDRIERLLTMRLPDNRRSDARADVQQQAAIHGVEVELPSPSRIQIKPLAERHTSSPSWIARWLTQRDSAIAFLRARGLLATVIDRDAEILHYRLTGKRYHYTAEDLVELAQAMGFEASDAH